MTSTKFLLTALECRRRCRASCDNIEEFRALFDKLFAQVEKVVHDGDCRSYCYKRLRMLETRFKLYKIELGEKEEKEQCDIDFRDFYSVTKVDTHIHLSACMTQKHLLRFIQHKVKTEPQTLVWKDKDGQVFTLQQVFNKLNIDPERLTTNSLNMRADSTFQRFDLFMMKYSPFQKSLLREIFLKYDNDIKGRFLAEILKEVLFDLEKGKHVYVEYRVSIYGKHAKEWNTLAEWIKTYDLLHPNLRLLVQIPRLYQLHKEHRHVQTFQDMLNNIFHPIFEASIYPNSNPLVTWLLTHIVGFDCVDNESGHEIPYSPEIPHASKYVNFLDPPYIYFLLHMFFHIQRINQIRQERGLSTFAFRPHAGEAGSLEHLSCAFLLADGINHGILLAENPTLQYLFYLAHILISVSPLSNNQLFLSLVKSPFFQFFSRGLFVTLSTDNPCLTHFSKEPLMEEYSISAQLLRLGAVDLCEIARNSVLQSSFPEEWKKVHASPNNSNVPSMRLQFREDMRKEEFKVLQIRARL